MDLIMIDQGKGVDMEIHTNVRAGDPLRIKGWRGSPASVIEPV